eukprot:m.404749 g.404749  ORF g.404749 m.404749 type:complete len:178 (+) comp21200_c0_seq9:1776-2309(+)
MHAAAANAFHTLHFGCAFHLSHTHMLCMCVGGRCGLSCMCVCVWLVVCVCVFKGHQRACLHAVIDVPHWGGLVDVFTVHLSLSERARDRSVREIWSMASNTSVARGVTQILLGDLNAEPQERAMKFFTGDADIEGDTGAFVDAWTAVHPEVCACVACISCPVTFVAFSCDMPYDAMC